MSRIDELKKQYKEFALSDLDIMKMIVPDQANKYTELMVKLTRNHINEAYNITSPEFRNDLLQILIRDYGLDYAYLETLETSVIIAVYRKLDQSIGSNKVRLFTKFANLNERGLIDNNDVTSYKSFNELEQAVSVAEIKLIDKKLAKQIVKVYEDDEWLLLKPLSLEASMKYGANTKWCTTMEKGVYFARYSKRGILIYAINKQTGFKFASFKNLDPSHDNEFSFWDAADSKIEPLDIMAIPTEILSIIRNEVNTNSVSNQSLMSKELQDKLITYEYPDEIRPSEPIAPMAEQVVRFTASPPSIPYFSNTGNIGNITVGNIVPSTQLSITGDLEIREGNIKMIDNTGVERARFTSNGITFPENQYPEQIEETIQELFREIEEHLERATEQVVEQRAQQQNILNDIEVGTLSEDYKKRLQLLAGIDPVTQNTISERAELDDVPSEQQISLFAKLKNRMENIYKRITTKNPN